MKLIFREWFHLDELPTFHFTKIRDFANSRNKISRTEDSYKLQLISNNFPSGLGTISLGVGP